MSLLNKEPNAEQCLELPAQRFENRGPTKYPDESEYSLPSVPSILPRIFRTPLGSCGWFIVIFLLNEDLNAKCRLELLEIIFKNTVQQKLRIAQDAD